MRLAAIWIALLIGGDGTVHVPRVGDSYLIVSDRQSSEQASNGSTSSSSDRDAIVEHVVGLREDGIVMAYDLPPEIRGEQRAAVWQLPARVLRLPDGSLRLLNADELARRVDPWLKRAKWTRAVCGRLIFTWNAFRVECDPQTVIPLIQQFEIQPPGLKDGAAYLDPDAAAPGPWTRIAGPDGGARYLVGLVIDPDKVRRARAQVDVGIAEISGTTKTLDAAMRDHAGERISGTIDIALDTNADGLAVRRTKVVKLRVEKPDGIIENRMVTERIERRLVSSDASANR